MCKHEFRPLVIKQIFLTSAIFLLLVFLLLGCVTISESNKITIAEIKANPSKFFGKKVMISGIYMGWKSKESPPVTRSDWVIDDGSGRIYVTKCFPGFDPVKDAGKKNVTVVGYVRMVKGKVYLEAIKCMK